MKAEFPVFAESLPRVIASIAVGILGTWLIMWSPFSAPSHSLPEERWKLELNARAVNPCILKFSFDFGHGFPPIRLQRDIFVAVSPSASLQPISVLLPPGRLLEAQITVLKTDVLDIGEAQVIPPGGVPVNRQSPNSFVDLNGANPSVGSGALELHAIPGAENFRFKIHFPTPIRIAYGDEPSSFSIIALLILLSWGCWAGLRRMQTGTPRPSFAALGRMFAIARKLLTARPILSLFLIACISMVASSYPIVFFGRSLVSPNTTPHLYHSFPPTLPDTVLEEAENVNWSDVYAMEWAHMPYATVEERALFKDGEFPLWNRFNSCGVTLLGQGQSMIGDPLHLCLLALGASWQAWDLKFLAAKLLFGFGIGCCIWLSTRRLGLSLLLTASSLWIGYFQYRYNHAAIFGVCYGPWLLLPWIGILQANKGREALTWAFLLILADLAELNSGTAKEASMLILCMNASGLLLAVASSEPWKRRKKCITLLLGATFLFILLSAPCWLVFADTLHHSFTAYDKPEAIRLPFSLGLSLFDEIFAQELTEGFSHRIPSTNFLVLVGVMLLVSYGRKTLNDRTSLPLLIACVPLVCLVFPIIPTSWILHTPILGNIYHISNTFSCPLLILLSILAGKGFQFWLEDTNRTDRLKRGVAVASGLLLFVAPIAFALLKPHISAGQAEMAWNCLRDSFFLPYTTAIFLSAWLFPWALTWASGGSKHRLPGCICLGVTLIAIHFRGGMYVATRFDDYVMNPKMGVALIAHAPSVTALQQKGAEPWRVCGLNETLAPGYSGVLGIEGINAPDAIRNRYYQALCDAAGFETAFSWKMTLRSSDLLRVKPVLDSLNTRYLLHESGTPPPSDAQVSLLGSYDLDIYESGNAWPRAFFTDGIKTSSTATDYISQINSGDGKPFATVEPGLKVPAGKSMKERRISAARDYALSNNKTAFTLDAPGPGIAVLLETYEEGDFRLTVNGVETPYVRANQAFKGVLLPRAGTYRIEFSYWPRMLTPALYLAGAGFLLACGGAFWISRQNWAGWSISKEFSA